MNPRTRRALRCVARVLLRLPRCALVRGLALSFAVSPSYSAVRLSRSQIEGVGPARAESLCRKFGDKLTAVLDAPDGAFCRTWHHT